jgi:hypothetical protein
MDEFVITGNPFFSEEGTARAFAGGPTLLVATGTQGGDAREDLLGHELRQPVVTLVRIDLLGSDTAVFRGEAVTHRTPLTACRDGKPALHVRSIGEGAGLDVTETNTGPRVRPYTPPSVAGAGASASEQAEAPSLANDGGPASNQPVLDNGCTVVTLPNGWRVAEIDGQ